MFYDALGFVIYLERILDMEKVFQFFLSGSDGRIFCTFLPVPEYFIIEFLLKTMTKILAMKKTSHLKKGLFRLNLSNAMSRSQKMLH